MAKLSELERFLPYLTGKPWWVSVLIDAAFFLVFRYVIPNLPVDYGPLELAIDRIFPIFSWAALVLLLPACLSIIRRTGGDGLLANTKTRQALNAMDWQAFEELIEPYYRNLSYNVQRQLERGPDGGVDVRITNDRGERVLVQCKQYRDRKVDVSTVRELMGIVYAERATSGIVITTTTAFTNEAREFSESVPIELIDGDRLGHLLQVRL